MPTPAKKQTLRVQCRQRRQALPQNIRLPAITAFTARTIAFLAERAPGAKCVGGYYPMPEEMDIRPLLQVMMASGANVALPLITPKNTLSFKKTTTLMPDELVRHPNFSVMEPPMAWPDAEPQVLIVPLLGFDDNCHRLGFGGGYYDRAIASLRAANYKVLVVGAAFECQKLSKMPSEPHDARLDAVITEHAVYQPPKE
jgi:5-formyltetrahydrofolate cyclo-ligase